MPIGNPFSRYIHCLPCAHSVYCPSQKLNMRLLIASYEADYILPFNQWFCNLTSKMICSMAVLLVIKPNEFFYYNAWNFFIIHWYNTHVSFKSQICLSGKIIDEKSIKMVKITQKIFLDGTPKMLVIWYN